MGEFEKDIRDMFADYELQIDTEEIWPGIERKLERSKRRKRFFWWWFTPLLLIIPIGYFFAVNIGEKDVRSSTNTSIQDEIKLKKNRHANDELAINQIYNADNDKQKDELNKSQLGKNKKSATKSFTKLSSIYDNQASETDPEIIMKENSESLPESADVNTIEGSPVIKPQDQSKIAVFKRTELLNSLIRPFNYLRSFIPEIKSFPVIPEKMPKSTNWDRSLDIAMGIAFADKFLKAEEESFNNYKNKRIKTESHLEAISASIKYQVNHKSGLFLNTGLNYCQIDEKFSDNDSVDLFKSGDGIISIITNPDGSVIENRGKKEVVEHRTWNKEIYNYYFFFDIPLNIGYAGKIRKVNYEISSGISYNLSFLKKGQIIGIYNYPVSIDKDSGIFRTRSGFSLNSGIKVLIPYKNHMFFIEPNLKYNLQSITNNEYPLSQKYLTYGLEIGGRIKL